MDGRWLFSIHVQLDHTRWLRRTGIAASYTVETNEMLMVQVAGRKDAHQHMPTDPTRLGSAAMQSEDAGIPPQPLVGKQITHLSQVH
jgi:hypothetical protein